MAETKDQDIVVQADTVPPAVTSRADIKELIGNSSGSDADQGGFVAAHRADGRTFEEISRIPSYRELAEKGALEAFETMGRATSVSVNGGGRWMKFQLKLPNGKVDYNNGVAEIITLSTCKGGKELIHTFSPPILVAAGEGLNDERRPISVEEFAEILRCHRIVTNDKPQYNEAEVAINEKIEQPLTTPGDALELSMTLNRIADLLQLIIESEDNRSIRPNFKLDPSAVTQFLSVCEELDADQFKDTEEYKYVVSSIENALSRLERLPSLREKLTPYIRVMKVS